MKCGLMVINTVQLFKTMPFETLKTVRAVKKTKGVIDFWIF